MALRRCITALSTYASRSSACSTSSWRHQPGRAPPAEAGTQHARRYVSHVDGTGGATGRATGGADRHRSSQWPTCANPTPYDIFDQPPSAPYSKRRFCELVKLYHPDRCQHTSHDGVSRAAKLERYRLVVAANDILSDPARRSMYDLCGAGWGKRADTPGAHRAGGRGFRQRQEPPWGEQQDGVGDGGGQDAPPFPNWVVGFVMAITVMAASWGQFSRAGPTSARLLESREQRHAAVSRTMRRRERELAGLSRQDRVEHFLRSREGWDDEDAVQGQLSEDASGKRGRF